MNNDKKILGQYKKLWLLSLGAIVCLVFVMVALKSPAHADISRLDLNWHTGLTGYTVPAGSDRLLVFVTGFTDTGPSEIDVTAVTYGGVSMSPGEEHVNLADNRVIRCEIWYLKEADIPTGSNNFVVTYDAPPDYAIVHAAATYADVYQTTPIYNNNKALTSSNPVSTTVNVVQGGMSISGAVARSVGSYDWTGGDLIETTDQNVSSKYHTMGTAEHAVTTTGTDTASASYSGGSVAQVIVAVSLDPASATTRTVAIHPSGTTAPLGYDATYTSMSEMEAAENGDLVALNRFLRVEIVNSDGDWIAADTAVVFDGWKCDRSAGQYVEIEVMSGARNPYTDGKWSTSHYRLSSASSTEALVIDNDAAADAYFEADFIGLQAENTGGDLALQIRDDAWHKTIKFKGCHFRGTAGFEVLQLMDNGSANGHDNAEVWFINTIIENSLSTNDDEIVRATSAWTATAYFYNCTIVGGGIEGLDVDQGTITVKNCAVFNNDNTDILALGGAAVDYNASDNSVGTNWVDISPAAEADGWNAAVIDYVNGDYRVKDTNSVLYQAGLSRSSDSNVPSEDIAGNARPTGSNPVSIGAFEASSCGSNLVMVVGTDTSQIYDAAKQTLFEGWGWTVTTINDTDSQTVFNTAATSNDVMYISESVSSGNVNTKARDLNIGIVDDECWLWDEMEYGPTGNGGADWGTTINITSTSHYITSGFSGSLTVYSTGMNLNNLPSSLTVDGQLLGETPNGGEPTLFAYATGATLDSGTAVNRRVGFPSFDSDPANWTANLETLLQRSLDWAAGCGEAGGGGASPVPVASDDSFTTDEDVNLNGDVSTNDDLADEPSTVDEVLGVSNGVLTLNADGSFTYDPDVGFSGTDSFTYQVTDTDNDISNVATVTITVNPAGGTPVPNLEEYSSNMKITIDNTKVAGDLNEFPVLISLTDDSLKTTGCGFMTDVDGDDLIFTNSSKTIQLDHEIEKYDDTTGELVAWVEIPFLSGSSNTDIYMYFGNSNVTSPTENPTDVWDSNHVGVWHLKEDAAIVAPTTDEWRISDHADDSEEVISSGSIDWGSSDLELGEAGSPQIVGMRWRNVAIPQGTTITSAYIEFTVDEVQTGTPANVTFWGEDVDNAAVFADVAYNISSTHYNNKTSASVAWNNIPGWDTVGQTKQSPDIKAVIQEIVDRPGWVSGNALVVLVTGSGRRTADSYSEPTKAPLLHVEYTTATDLHLDSTSNDNDGIPYGNTLTPSGKIDGAQDFDGVDDYVDAGNGASLDVNYITIEFWLKVNSWVSDGGILSKGTSSARRYWIWTYGGTVAFEIDEGGNHNGAWNPPSGQWQHLALTYDGSNVITYRNGDQEINTYPQATGTIDATAEPLLFGDIPPYNHADMDLDEVRISNTVRSPEWIQTSYNNQNAPSSFYSVETNFPSTIPPIAEFTCSVPITIDHTKVSGTSNLVNFPVLISLTDTGLKSAASCGYVENSNGYDIIFSDATQTTVLDHELEKYDSASGELVAWVRVPTLKYDEDTVINIHFGHNDVCGATENPTGVWDSNYTAVWHLKETSGGADTIKDSTARANHGTDFNSPTFGVTGKIGNAVDFDGTADYVTMPTSGFNTSAGTVELWTNIDTFPSADNKYMFSHFTPSPIANRVYVNLKPDNTWGTGMGDTYDLVRGSVVSAGTWYHLVLTWDGTNVRGYKDGVLNFGPTSYTGLTTVGNIYVSAWDDTAEWFDGTLDEVRVSEAVRSADWIQTEYNNQSDPSSFYSVGASSCFSLGGFSCNRRITIDSTKVEGSSDLTNFPFLIRTQNDCNLKTAANGGAVQNSSGWDIIFTDSDGVTQLDHEIEEYNGTTGDLTAWVRVPTLPYNSDKDIYMYYGKSDLACDPSNPTGVWDSSYEAVYHLNDDFEDSTSHIRDATAEDTDNYSAVIADGEDFSPHEDIAIGNWNFSGDELTLQAWARFDDFDQNDPRVFSKANGTSEQNHVFMLGLGGNLEQHLRMRIKTGTDDLSGTTTIVDIDDPLSSGNWYSIAGTYDGSNMRLLSNGAEVHSAAKTGNLRVNSWDIALGNTPGGTSSTTYSMDGKLDEVRILSVARSADWLKTEYNNQSDPDAFSTISQDTCGGEYGFNFQYCKKIVVDHTQVDSDLTDFPLLINLANDDDLKTVANGGRVQHSQGWDILFRTSGCGNLDHEIEKYDGSTGDLVAWVRIPTLSSSTDTEIYMYYGATVICSTENPAGVWDSNYVGVWHLDETVSDESTAGTHYDSTGNSNNGAQNDNDDTENGKIGTGQMFDGGSDWIQVPNSGSLDITGDKITLSAWVKSTADQNDDAGIINKSYSNNYNYMLNVQSNEVGNFRVKAPSGTTYLDGSTTLNVGQWYFLYGIYDGANAKVYLNGSEDGTDIRTGNIESSGDAPVVLGRRRVYPTVDDRFFTGVIDEVHISNVARTTDWMITEFRNQNDPGNFYTVGSCFEQTSEVTQEWVEEVQ